MQLVKVGVVCLLLIFCWSRYFEHKGVTVALVSLHGLPEEDFVRSSRLQLKRITQREMALPSLRTAGIQIKSYGPFPYHPLLIEPGTAASNASHPPLDSSEPSAQNQTSSSSGTWIELRFLSVSPDHSSLARRYMEIVESGSLLRSLRQREFNISNVTIILDPRYVEYTTCGDGTVTRGETCDDGNRVSGDGCSSVCQFELKD
mmetsp:Transcript_45066/g.70642  ORF Transcript_45066/g.70642 Transcript_45066/m.70642 type:complete len:203 (-) Transcript_45066:110-718(-)